MSPKNKKRGNVVEIALLSSQNTWVIRTVGKTPTWVYTSKSAEKAIDYCLINGLDIQVTLDETKETIEA